jgi:hypothetical protein
LGWEYGLDQIQIVGSVEMQYYFECFEIVGVTGADWAKEHDVAAIDCKLETA